MPTRPPLTNSQANDDVWGEDPPTTCSRHAWLLALQVAIRAITKHLMQVQ